MAKKGTYGGLQTQGGAVDFGDVARTVTGDIEGKRQTLLKEELIKSQQETAQKKYAQKLRKQSYDDMVAFSKEAKEIMNVDTSGMLNPVLTEVLKISQIKYADMTREFKPAGTGRRAELLIEMERYKSISKNMNAMGAGIDYFFKDYNSLVNGKPKYSAFGSSKTMLGTIQAIKDAANKGLTKNEDGTYAWGDKITIENMGTPDMKLKIMGTDGEELAYNSMQSITAGLSSGLKPYNDFPAIIQGIASKVKPSVSTTADVNNTTLTYDKAIDVKETMISINATLNNMLGGDNSDRMKELINRGDYGDIPSEIRKNLAKTIFDMQKKDHAIKISKRPDLQEKIKKDANKDASSSVRNIMAGDKSAIKAIKSQVWNDVIEATGELGEKSTVENGKLEDINTSDPNTIVVTVLGKKNKRYKFRYNKLKKSDRMKFAQNVLEARQGISGMTSFDTMVALKGVDFTPIDRSTSVREGEARVPTEAEALGQVKTESTKTTDRGGAY